MYVYRLNSQLSMLRMPTGSNPADAEELIAHGNAAAGTRYRRVHASASRARPQLALSGVQRDVLARDDRALRRRIAREALRRAVHQRRAAAHAPLRARAAACARPG